MTAALRTTNISALAHLRVERFFEAVRGVSGYIGLNRTSLRRGGLLEANRNA